MPVRERPRHMTRRGTVRVVLRRSMVVVWARDDMSPGSKMWVLGWKLIFGVLALAILRRRLEAAGVSCEFSAYGR